MRATRRRIVFLKLDHVGAGVDVVTAAIGHVLLDRRAARGFLRRRVDGEVRFDVGSQAAYAMDSSNYRQVPLAVVAPRTVDAAVAAVAVCAERGVPVLSRGGGTSLAGQTTNRAVVMDGSTATTSSPSTPTPAPASSSPASPSTS